MIFNPKVSYFIPGLEKDILPGMPLWNSPLAGKSSTFAGGSKAGSGGRPTGPSIGEYFLGAQRVLLRDNCRMLVTAVGAMGSSRQTKGQSPITRVSLRLEKHGAFYHPIKVRVDAGPGPSLFFVLNGAVSSAGLDLIDKEYSLLSLMGQKEYPSFTPRVFGVGQVSIAEKNMAFFLGEWFEGFHEFHFSRVNGEDQISIWESDGTCSFISLEAAGKIYENIAHCLTLAFDLETGSQVFPWHHAAGDFVVGSRSEDFPVRLITVRGYAPLIELQGNCNSSLLQRLLFFFLNMSVRMRLDRQDGIGDSVFLDDTVLKAAIRGVLSGLDRKKGFGQGELRSGFAEFIEGFDVEQLCSIIIHMLDAWRPGEAELGLILENLDLHCKGILAAVKTQGRTDFY